MAQKPGEDVDVWMDRVLVSLAAFDDARAPSGVALLQAVAARFADLFSASDRVYDGDEARWHLEVRSAVRKLRHQGLVIEGPEAGDAPVATDTRTPADGPALTDDGRARAETADPESGRRSTAATRRRRRAADDPPPLLMPGVIAAPLRDPRQRAKMRFPTDEDRRMPVMVELNLRYGAGPAAAFEQLSRLWVATAGEPAPSRLADEYATGSLSLNEMKRLVSADAAAEDWSERCMYRLWPDFPVRQHVDASSVTVKVDAARRAFNAFGDRIVWAVVDSGIDGTHPHFEEYRTLSDASVRNLHRVFPADGPRTAEGALEDETGHGTHVAGIIAGGIGPWVARSTDAEPRTVWATRNRYNIENPTEALRVRRDVEDYDQLAGMAARAKLVSLKVLHRGGTLEDRVSRVIAALAYVREVNGQGRAGMRIHGVNLSVGYEFNPEWFACGQSPLCQEVDKLVRSGVVVVVAAGNSGFGTLGVQAEAPTKFGLGVTINDPGNAERAITVGSTHRDMPHTYGVSYFSSKGPTGDGRRKPDLVAPGEQITSCAAGDKLKAITPSPQTPAVYVEDSGTSMAAPHVSGAIAAFLSVRREFIGRPDTVKQIVVDSATSLGREAHFQGSGLLDLMRALQSV